MFTVDREVEFARYYQVQTGIMINKYEKDIITLEYTAKSVESLDLDGKCTVLFVITSPGAIRDAVQELVFQYQGTGDPLAEAEAVLRAALIP
ncbi:hypothetical protein WJF93_004141 [Klebsiella pneumoniae]